MEFPMHYMLVTAIVFESALSKKMAVVADTYA
jgi:hypothetical protein